MKFRDATRHRGRWSRSVFFRTPGDLRESKASRHRGIEGVALCFRHTCKRMKGIRICMMVFRVKLSERVFLCLARGSRLDYINHQNLNQFLNQSLISLGWDILLYICLYACNVLSTAVGRPTRTPRRVELPEHSVSLSPGRNLLWISERKAMNCCCDHRTHGTVCSYSPTPVY